MPDAREPVSKASIGDRIRSLMATQGLSQTELAKKSGIDRSDLNRVINNHRPPRLSELPLLAAALGVGVDDLLDGAEVSPAYRRELAKINQSALRFMEAEAARDEAIAKAEGLSRALSEAGLAFDHDRERWAADLERQRKAWEARLASAERDKAETEKQLSDTRREAVELKAQVAGQAGTIAALRAEVVGLRKQLADENSAKVLTGVLSGLAGLAAGTIVGRASDDSDDDEIE